MGAERNSGDITRTQAKPPTPSALHPRHDHPGFGTSLAPANERTNGSMKPRPMPCERCERTNKAPTLDVCSFVRREPDPHKASTRGFVRSQKSCRRPTTPKPQHYPRQRLARTIAQTRTMMGTPSVKSYARASLNSASKQVLQYSSSGRSTSAPHEHLDRDDSSCRWA